MPCRHTRSNRSSTPPSSAAPRSRRPRAQPSCPQALGQRHRGPERRPAARRREDRRRVGDPPVDQEGRAAVFPHARQPRDCRAATLRYFDKVPRRFDGYTDAQFREGGFRVVPPAVARAGYVHRQERRPDAVVRQHRRLRRRGHDGRHVGDRRVVRADRQERPPLGRRRHRRRARAAAGELRRSSRTTASSAPARKSSKASSSRRTR